MPSASLTVLGTPDNFVHCAIVRDADWLDPLPGFLENGAPRDLTGKQLMIYVRPSYEHVTSMFALSTQTGTIILDDAAGGLASIYITRNQLIGSIPAGVWAWFCVMRDPADETTKELFRGQLEVHDGRIS